MKKKLVAAALETLPEGEYWDALQPTLILRVGRIRKTWQCKFRSGGKNHRVRLGYYPELGLAAARTAAADLGKRVDSGLRALPAPAAAHPRSADALTLGKLIDRYEALKRKEGGRVKRLDESLRTVRRGLKDYLDLPAREFSKADSRAARDAINEGNSHMGNRLLGYFGPVMRWAAAEDLVPTNFVRDIRRAPEAKRERVLSKTELKAIWKASHELGGGLPATNFGRMTRFLAATAQRVGEAASMRHGDLLGGIWKQADNKASREHRLKLPPIALDQVGTGTATELVFPGEADNKIGAVSKLKARLDASSGVTDWRLHDLRRTAASGMQELGIRNDTIQAVLNHQVPGVGQVYLRGELDKQKADALATWAAELGRIVGARRAAS